MKNQITYTIQYSGQPNDVELVLHEVEKTISWHYKDVDVELECSKENEYMFSVQIAELQDKPQEEVQQIVDSFVVPVFKRRLGEKVFNHPKYNSAAYTELIREEPEDSEEDQVDIYSIVYKDKQKWEKAWPAIKAHLEKQSEAFVSDIAYEYGTAGLFTVFATYKPHTNVPKDVRLQHLRVSLAEVLKEELDIDSNCI